MTLYLTKRLKVKLISYHSRGNFAIDRGNSMTQALNLESEGNSVVNARHSVSSWKTTGYYSRLAF